MNKKLRFAALFLTLLLILSLCACGSGAKSASTMAVEAPAAYDMAEAEESVTYGGISPAAGAASSNGSDSDTSLPAGQTEKIIYSADAGLETTKFDDTLTGIKALVSELGGYMESTGIYGNNYYQTASGHTGGRSASFTIRVPGENFEQLTTSLSDLGNVPYCNTYSNNITRQYYDVQARLTAYETQEARLLEMLAVAESVDDMLAIRQQLTEVQYEIDSLNSTLKNYDHSVSYSTVNLSVDEVEEYTPSSTVTLTFGEKLVRGFRDSLRGIGNFFTELVLWLGRALPVLAVLAAVVFLVWFFLRRALWSASRRRAEKRVKKGDNISADPADGTSDK